MRTRSFIGLILLVVILIVASTPALLTPSANGIERLLVKAGALTDHDAAYERAKKTDASQSTDPVDAQLLLKGHMVEKDGDVRDTATAAERASNQRGRLAAGDVRVLLPGQLENQDAYTRPPVTSEDGLLLDATGCPVFPSDADPVALMTDEDTRTQYEKKAQDADDSEACAASLNAQVRDARNGSSLLPADRLRVSMLARSDSERLWLELMRLDLFVAATGANDADVVDAATSARASLADR